MKILAIETSHDDSSVCLFEDKKILWEKTMTQTEFHKKFGGTVPEYASRRHAINLGIILEELKQEFDLSEIDHIAYTAMPGLIGSLHMGQLFANGLGMALNKPVFKINHMHAHIFAAAFNHEITYPSIALIVSGGHTQLWKVENPYDIKLIGETSDDAAGEVFDKVARAMYLGFPGGPVIDKLYYEGEDFVDFKMNDDKTLNFSFSGIKTKVKNYIHNKNQKNEKYNKANVAAGFQKAVVDILILKTKRAIELHKPSSIILGGGVAANSLLRDEFAKIHNNALIPERKFTTDNAMMIAMMSYMMIK